MLPPPNALSTAYKRVNVLRKPWAKDILVFLDRKESATPTEIFTMLRTEQSQASQWLARMVDAGLLNVDTSGKHRNYSINYDQIKSVSNAVSEFAQAEFAEA